MQLTPIPFEALPGVLESFAGSVSAHALARSAIDRIAATLDLVPAGADLPAHREDAVVLARSFGIRTLDQPPAVAFSWDGSVLRTRSEASVILHEVAHWQLCPPDRRGLPDFGLGAGPETGLKAEADRAAVTSFDTREREEKLASLLGVLWEAELGQPAVLAFLEQNWLEGWDRPAAAGAFGQTLDTLAAGGFVDAAARPTRHVNAAVPADAVMT